MKIVICGLSITSSWGNGHATTYRALVQGLCRRGHQVLFLERDKPWYASHRDLTELPMGALALYNGLSDLDRRFRSNVIEADFVMIGSFVPEGAAVAEWALHNARGAVGFYDIDTPVTLGKLRSGDEEFLKRAMIPRFDIYLSFTGGRTLKLLEEEYGARWAVPLYCSVDPEVYYPEKQPRVWDLGYLGTYSEDRQPALERFLLEPARKLPDRHFSLAGSMYPPHLSFPPNVERMEHLAPSHHRKFYNAQKFTLNITRRQMIEAGYSPSIRLFEAGACEVAIISDYWAGIDEILEPGKEILIAANTEEMLDYLTTLHETEARHIAAKARGRILAEHTADSRSAQLERYIHTIAGNESASKVFATNTAVLSMKEHGS